MTTVTDRSLHREIERSPALLDLPQPLGFLPTLQFWRDPENKRRSGLPTAIVAVTLLFATYLLRLSWWVAGLVLAVGMLLIWGLFERYIRHAAKRRFRPHREQAVLADNQEPSD
jgi:hypothetical protein